MLLVSAVGASVIDLGLTPAALAGRIGASLARIEEKEGADDQR